MALQITQMILSVALIGLILIQERSAGTGGLFGGGAGSSYQTRRGLEKVIYWATLAIAFTFGALAIASLVLGK
ncbi:MAG: preprotein translocase subunit SecG [bacterium]|nr:preprotein translocase subunit SecG [Candidatus Jorgensenbacteria bacterium]